MDEFRAATGKQPKPCLFSREVLSKLNEEQLGKVADALVDDQVSAQAIATIVGRWVGFDVDHQGVYRHRKGTCSCDR